MKNAHIIHKIKNKRYMCIRAVDPTPEKSSLSWRNVTCKNCLSRMPEHVRASIKSYQAKKAKLVKKLPDSTTHATFKVKRSKSGMNATAHYLRAVPPGMEPSKLKLVEQDEEQMKLRDRLCFSAGYAQGMRAGIIGNYIIVAAALALAVVLVIVL